MAFDIKTLKTVKAPSKQNPNPRFTLIYGNTGIGKTPVVASHEMPPEGGVKTLPIVLEEIGWGKDSLLHIDLEKPSGSSFIVSNSATLQTKEAFLQFIEDYQEEVFKRLVIHGIENGLLTTKKDGATVPFAFGDKITLENVGDKLGFKAVNKMAEATRNSLLIQVETIRTNLSFEEQKKVYPFMVGVLDIYTILLDWCEFFTTAEFQATTVGKNFRGENLIKESDSMGKWKFWRETCLHWTFDKIGQLFPHVIMVCHTRDKLINSDNSEMVDGEGFSIKDVNITGKLASMLASRCDAVGYMYRVKGNPMLQMNFNRDEEHATSKAKVPHMWGLTEGMDFDWSKIFVTPEGADKLIQERVKASKENASKAKETAKK